MDGWVVIGTKLDTKQLEKDLKSSERQLRKYENEAEKLTDKKAKLEIDLQGYYEAKKEIVEMTNEALKLAQTEGEVSQQLRLEQTELEKLDLKYSKQLDALEDVEMQMKENTKNQALLNNEIDETNRKLQQSKGISSVSGEINDIGKQTSKAIRGVGKWALAIFGLRSAYMFVRQSASTLAQYNDQIASDLEYISFAMASMLQPIIEKMIQLVYKLLNYVNYIAKAWFGVDLFANASADAMKRGASSAEKMKKSLAGFDEMNVLNENGTTGAMGSVAPSVDLSETLGNLQGDWFLKNKDDIITGLIGIAAGLLAIKSGLGLIKGFGIGLALYGILQLITDLLEFLDNPTFSKFVEILQDIALAITGIGIAAGSLPVAIGGALALIVTLFISKFNEIMGLFDKLINYVNGNFSKKMTEKFGAIGYIISNSFGLALGIVQGLFGSFYGGIRTFIDGIIKIFKGDFVGGMKNIMDGVIKIVFAPLNAIINGVNVLINGINKIKVEVPDWVPKYGGEKIKFNLPKIPTLQLPKLAKGTILNYPGQGIPVAGGNAIAGEAGREAYLPLSDTQLLEELGSTIGKYITINANITNTMNGRVISRELQKINANSDFATNS